MSSELHVALGVSADDEQQIRILPPGEQPEDGVYIIAWDARQTPPVYVYATIAGEPNGPVGESVPVLGEILPYPVQDKRCHWKIKRVPPQMPGPAEYLITPLLGPGAAFEREELLYTGTVTPVHWTFVEVDGEHKKGPHAQYKIEESNKNPPRYWLFAQPVIPDPPVVPQQIRVQENAIGVTGYTPYLIYLGPLSEGDGA